MEGRDASGRFLDGHRKVGSHIPTYTKTGETHHQWRGDKASYAAKHMWVGKRFGKADHCEFDPSHVNTRFEWSNISGKYRRERSDWRQLCASCHRKLDWGDRCRQGHPFTPENTFIYPRTGHRKCRACAREVQRRYMARRKEVSNVS
jgi:hypothetical protein